MDYSNIKVIRDAKLSQPYDNRYVIVDVNSGEIIDDAQGYGYKTMQKAYAAYAYARGKKMSSSELAQRWLHNNALGIRCLSDLSDDLAGGRITVQEFKQEVNLLLPSKKKRGFTTNALIKEWIKLCPKIELYFESANINT